MQVLEDLCLLTLIIEEKYPTDKLVRHALERINVGLPELHALLTARPVVADIVAPAPVAVAAVEPKPAVELDPFTASVRAFLDDGWEDDPEPIPFRWGKVSDMLKGYHLWSGNDGVEIRAFKTALKAIGCITGKSSELKVAKRPACPRHCFEHRKVAPSWQEKYPNGWWHGLSADEGQQITAADPSMCCVVFVEETALPHEGYILPAGGKLPLNQGLGGIAFSRPSCAKQHRHGRLFFDRSGMFRVTYSDSEANRDQALDIIRTGLYLGWTDNRIADCLSDIEGFSVYRPAQMSI